jgi:hypothetical protein
VTSWLAGHIALGREELIEEIVRLSVAATATPGQRP